MNPLSPSDAGALIATLQNATSPQDNVRKPATATLKQLESRPGFASLLLLLTSSSPEINISINQFAAIQLKNVVSRNWRRGHIQDDERESLKQNLLQRLNEPNPHVAEQLLVVIAKIAREDVPTKWPNLFDSLTQQLTFPHAPFAMRTLNKVFKALSSKRKASDRRVYSELAAKMLPFMVDHWMKRQSSLFQMLGQAGYGSGGSSTVSNEVLIRLQAEATCCMYALKSICRLVVYGRTPLNQGTITHTFLRETFDTIGKVLTTVLDTSIVEGQRRIAAGVPLFDGEGDVEKEEKITLEGRLRSIVEVSLRTIGRVRSNQPSEFGLYLSTFLQQTYNIVIDQDARVKQHGDIGRRYETPALLACQFLSKCLTERDYEGANNQLGNMVSSFIFAKDSGSGGGGGGGGGKIDTRSKTLLRIITCSFMNLTTPDLMRWEEDPEEYILSQESVAVDSSLRPTAQDLYLALVEYDERSGPSLFVNIMRQTESEFDQRIRDGRTSESDLVKLAKVLDGMWTGAGLDTTLLKSKLNYSEWFMQRLVPVITSTVQQSQQQQQQQQQQFASSVVSATTTSPHQRILQYRALWLIGCLTYELPDDVHGPIYNALMELLTVNDVVVCVATITALRSMIDNVGFGRDPFTQQPGCAKAFIARLYWVLQQQNSIRSFDTRASILDIVSTLITNHNNGGLPGTVEEIVGPLPQLWSASAEQNLLRTSILKILTEIVVAVGTSPDAERVHLQVLPLVQYATDTSQSESVYLADEGLKLWQSIMSNTTSYTGQLHQLFQNVTAIMTHDFDRTSECMSLLESYICAGGVRFVQDHSSGLQNMFARAVGKVREPASLRLTRAMGLMLKIYPRDMPNLLAAVFVEMFRSIVASHADAVRRRGSGGTNVAPNHDLDRPRVIISYLSTLALLLMQTPDAFRAVLSSEEVARVTSCTSDVLWSLLVGQWIDRFDEIGGGATGPWVRKSWVMALCVPLESGDPVAVSRFSEIVNLCVHALADDTTSAPMFVPSPVKGGGSNGGGVGGGGGGGERMSLEAAARQVQQASDPVYCKPLKLTVQNAINQCQASVGQAFQQAIASTDSTTMSQLQSLLS
jgi:hypothetical protein